MNFRDKVFISVAENLSFSKAAEMMFISQPAVTKHIKEMESALNLSLFERKGNRVFLTKAGKLAYEHLKNIRQLYRDMEFELERLNDAFKGSLRIGASSTISQYVLPKILAAFHRRYPEIEIFLFNGNSFEMEQKLLANEIDLALVENMTSHQDFKYINLMEDEIIAVTSGSGVYGKINSISLTDIFDIPIILREQGSGSLQVILGALAKHSIELQELNIAFHLGSTEAIKNFLPEFDGIALISEKALAKEFRLRELVPIVIKQLSISRKFRIARRKGQVNSASKILIDFLLNYNYKL